MRKVFIPEIDYNYNRTGKKILVSKDALEKELSRCREYRWGNTQYMYSCHTEAYRRLSMFPELRNL